MPLGTLERKAPSFFRQGPSALSRLVIYSALALFFMVADARFHVTEPLRQAVAVVIYPLQWLMLQPVEFAGRGAGYFQSLDEAQQALQEARRQMAQMAVRASATDLLQRENAQLRELLALRARIEPPSLAAQVLYDTADPYSRKVTIDKGQLAGLQAGSPVLDARGVLGQVTRVFATLSEVTLLIDRDQTIPVLNARTGARSIAFGDPLTSHGGGMELRFTPGNADVQEGDLLITSGVDGVYPGGLPVARVVHIERRADSTFARIYCAPLAQMYGARQVLVLGPLPQPGAQEQAEPAQPAARATGAPRERKRGQP
ncbi:rod shape-determining protein MreC [Comamonas sp. NLF-1-9]|uniref:rod shape-determining protein MreC n=1 Tax=Comamonas sp. NLF-1-9 TaxID=2853163 RepID=UPI001C48136B|nr:rod shape-determining protein MreC [Comamonas sp. NLF-1-9]QXL83709.1 rod shape-determining protein MreC [Comamonas sp. NLF-1-9]